MKRIHKDLTTLIGHTPLVELGHIEKETNLVSRLIAKVEFFNPAGSIKDRVALSMIEDAEASSRLLPGGVVIEPTSGNTGIGLCAVAAARGYRAIVVMPDTMSVERRMLMTAFGAELVLTDGNLGMAGAITRAEELAAEIPGAIVAGQFINPANPAAHERTTGPEIWEDTDGDVDILVCGIGTGGTITGTGRYLKAQNPSVRVIGVEPASSAVLSGGSAGAHGLQGMGAGFVPAVLDSELLDEVIPVTDADAFAATRLLAQREGLLCGISSGAALHAAITVAARPENAGKTIVVLLPDTGERYLSSGIFS